MDQFISQPLKKFLFTSKEFAKKRREGHNLNAVQYSAGLDEAVIKMSEIKSIMRMNPKIQETNLDDIQPSPKQASKNNVLFSDSVETIDSGGSQNYVTSSNTDNISKNNNSTQLVTVKIIEEPVKKTATILNLSKTETEDCNPPIQEESDGEIHNLARQSVIKIKVKVVHNNDESISEPAIPSAQSIEEFQNIGITENKHDIGESCIFSENKSRPLSPIPVLPAQVSPKTNPFRTVDTLIDFHEREVHKIIGRSPPKTLPRMGTSALMHRSTSKTKLNDSEIISALVRDRFVVNMYESRSFRRSCIKKPSTYGRIYKSLERTANYKNDFLTKQDLLNSDIVSIKQSSPIKLKDQPVSLKTMQTLKLDDSSEVIQPKMEPICHDVNNVSIPEEVENDSSETLYKEEIENIPSSEYGSGSNSIQSSTMSLEQAYDSQFENTFGSEVSSYNMEDFLKKALGDELNNFDSAEISSKPPSPSPSTNPPPQEDSITTSNASDLISKINTFQSTLYHSFTKKLQHITDTLRIPNTQAQQKMPQDKQSVKSDLDSLFSNNEEVTKLLRQAAVQFETLKQISKALNVCRNSKEFCISSEQVEGERLLLIATYKRQAILHQIRLLEYPTPSPATTSTGCITITNISLPLKPSTPEQPRGRDVTKWYVAVFSSGLQIIATQPTPAAADGSVWFREEVVFEEQGMEFEVNVEVFCLLQRRQGRNFSHESKYHINKDTKRSHCPTPKKFLSREKSSQKIPASYDTGIRTSAFKLSGSLKLTVADLTKSGSWELRGKIPLCSALGGTISLNLKSSVQIPIKQSGFLTIGSESGGYTSWNRRWCVLDGHVIKYWNYPSDEETSGALKELDLKYCVSSKVDIADRSICARPRTLLIEIARKSKPQDSDTMMMACHHKSYTVERYYLSADSIGDLNVWQKQLDTVVQALRIWSVGFLL